MSRRDRIEHLIKAAMPVVHLEILDESHQHSGNGQESHLRLILVSDRFSGLSRILRQKTIYQLVDAELKTGLHALTMRIFTPDEWKSQGGVDTSQSPPCFGGSKVQKP